MCIGYFSLAVIKHHNQVSLQKEEFIWAYGSREIGIHHGWGGRTGGSGTRTLNTHLFGHLQETESKLEVGQGSELSDLLPEVRFLQQDHTSETSTNSYTNWGQVLKYMRLWDIQTIMACIWPHFPSLAPQREKAPPKESVLVGRKHL